MLELKNKKVVNLSATQWLEISDIENFYTCNELKDVRIIFHEHNKKQK